MESLDPRQSQQGAALGPLMVCVSTIVIALTIDGRILQHGCCVRVDLEFRSMTAATTPLIGLWGCGYGFICDILSMYGVDMGALCLIGAMSRLWV